MVPIDRRPVIAPVESQQGGFPFGPEFQTSLFRLLLDDTKLSHVIGPYLEPGYFESEPLAWGWAFCLRYQAKYSCMPGLRVLLQEARGLDPRIRPLYTAVIDSVSSISMRDEEWLRDQVVEFIRRNIFVRVHRETQQLYNAGRENDAYELMIERMDRVEQMRRTVTEAVDRSWLCAELPARQSKRLGQDGRGDAIPTGLRWLDKILDGGLHLGELGIWIAEPKSGKTTMLIQHGVAGVRLGGKNVLHCVFEGSLNQTATRYDGIFGRIVFQGQDW
jgi:hypothetical protein